MNENVQGMLPIQFKVEQPTLTLGPNIQARRPEFKILITNTFIMEVYDQVLGAPVRYA